MGDENGLERVLRVASSDHSIVFLVFLAEGRSVPPFCVTEEVMGVVYALDEEAVVKPGRCG
jgi:hypothetical protein